MRTLYIDERTIVVRDTRGALFFGRQIGSARSHQAWRRRNGTMPTARQVLALMRHANRVW